jgi:hypothetical protein
VASCKFALGQVLLDLATRQQTLVPLPDLAFPYAVLLCEHLQVEERRATRCQTQRVAERNRLPSAHAGRAAED